MSTWSRWLNHFARTLHTSTRGSRKQIPRKTYIRAIHDTEPFFDAFLAKYRSTSGWRTYEVPTGHDVMIDMPERLTEILLEMA